MNSRNALISAIIAATAIAYPAQAQTLSFHEVPAGISLFASPTIFSVTDKGDYLLVLSNYSGPGSAFIYNGHTLTAVHANTGDTFYAMNTPGYLVGFGNNGSFLQDPKGNQTLLTAPAGDSISGYNLNNLNVVVGQGTNPAAGPFGFWWKAGVVTTYNYPGASNTSFYGSNDVGGTVGLYTSLTEQTGQAFYLNKAGKTSIINVPTYTYVIPSMVNNAGLIAGYVYNVGATTNQKGFYMNKAGKLTVFDYGDSAPVAMPGPKGPLMLQKQIGTTNVWGVNNLNWLCGSYIGNYEDAIGGYALAIPFVGQPG